MTVFPKNVRTVCDDRSVPILEITKEGETLTIYEADDMDRQIRFEASIISKLVACLEQLR